MKKVLSTLLISLAAFADPTIDQALAGLNQYAEVQKNLNVQDPDLSYGMRKALVMADLLFDQNGKLNLDSIKLVAAAFIPSQPTDFEANMARLLNELDATWQPFFDRVTAPANSLVLEALFSTKTITDRHAKVAVLAALLAPYNQGSVGDCFAVADVIRDHTEYYRNAAEDYRSIVMNGYVERPVNGSTDHFFFLTQLADTDLNNQISLTFPLFDSPGFAAARTLMGGDDRSDLADTVMSAIKGLDAVTPADVIGAMAQAIAPDTKEASASVGSYAFSSLTNNPILRGCEAAFAAMAEDRPQDSIRSNISDSITQALKNVLPNDQQFIDAFNQAYRLVYNLNIPLPQPAEDGSSTDGGFQMYKRSDDSTEPGLRIATPAQLRDLVLEVLNKAQIEDEKVTQYVQSDDFLKQVLWDYDSDNQKEPDPVGNFAKLSRTPMQSCDGDNPYEVDDIDTKTNYDKDIQAYTPSNAKDLIIWCLNLAKVAPAIDIPMNSPQHAFNFVPQNPDIQAFVKSGMSPEQWIKKTLVIPGMQVANHPMDPQVAKSILQGLFQAGLPDTGSIETLLSNLISQNLNIQAFAQKFLTGLIDQYPSDAQAITLVFDSQLLKNLSLNNQAILQGSAIRFANTNWEENDKDIYFCAYFNPRTEQIAFGIIFEDKTRLSGMDESQWVNNQQWDVDPKPFAPQAKR